MSDLAVSLPSPFRLSRLHRIALAGTALVVLGDWLFYERHIGISLALFLVTTAVLCVAVNGTRAQGAPQGKARIGAGLLLIVALLPLMEDVNILSIGFGLVGLGGFALIVARRWTGAHLRTFVRIIGLYAGPWRLLSRATKALQIARRRNPRRPFIAFLLAWFVPLLFGGIFVMLFSSANPLIGAWLGTIKLSALFSGLSLLRIWLWLLLAIATLPLLRVTVGLKRRQRKPVVAATLPVDPAWRDDAALFLSKGTILRSLILFNLLFAAQSAMDIAYLWGGVRLPGGMTYATYAHHGAYPLIATALLAAGFVLVALRPGSEAERSRPIRWLVTFWVGQNVLLVISSILRLDLYVDIYSLTPLRLYAFIWMGLVALGLVLILLRILRQGSNLWLVHANLIALAAVLYGCCFINFEAVVARYNVDHAREFTGRGVPLDLYYLSRLGPQALPALDRFLAGRQAMHQPPPDSVFQVGAKIRERLAICAGRTGSDWRGWTLQQARLWRYLDTTPAPTNPAREPTAATKAPESRSPDSTDPSPTTPNAAAPGDGN